MVRQRVWVSALGPKLLSISQLMFIDGDKNSVPVDVCGASVPMVVVVGLAPDVGVVERAVVEVVLLAVGVPLLLEQEAQTSANVQHRVTTIVRLIITSTLGLMFPGFSDSAVLPVG